MKDYTIQSKEKENFILNYKIENDNMIINYANSKKIIPYTKANVDIITSIMENQVNKGKLHWIHFSEELKDAKKMALLFGILLLITLPTVLFPFNLPFISILPKLLLAVIVYNEAKLAFEIKRNSEILKDIEKSKMFIDNKETIVKNLKKENQNEILTIEYEKDFNINDLEKIKLEELKDFLSNYKKENTNIENKAKVLRKK